MQNQKISCPVFLCPYKIKLCSFLMQNSISLFSLMSNICISHSVLLFFLLSLYSLILLHHPSRLNVFQLLSLSSTPMIVSSYHMFSSFTLHVPFSLALIRPYMNFDASIVV